MTKYLGALVASIVAALVLAAPALAAPPVNDNFANATVLTPAADDAMVTGTTSLATAEVSEPAHAGVAANHSVWFKYIPAVSQRIQVTDCYSDPPELDSDLAVYTGSALSNLHPVVSSATPPFNAGICGTRSIVEFNVTGGTTYYIAVDQQSGGSVAFKLHLFEHIPIATFDSGAHG